MSQLDEPLLKTVELSHVQLAECVGVNEKRFPKTYDVYISPAFKCYIGVLSLIVVASQVLNIITALSPPEGSSADAGAGAQIMFLVIFNLFYFGGLFAFAYFWVPKKVTRTIDSIIISFHGAKDKIIHIEDIKEIRVINNWSFADTCYIFKTYACRKVFWGIPTSLMRRMVIVTPTCCTNYQVSMTKEVMAEFLFDNSPVQTASVVAPTDIEASRV